MEMENHFHHRKLCGRKEERFDERKGRRGDSGEEGKEEAEKKRGRRGEKEGRKSTMEENLLPSSHDREQEHESGISRSG